MYLIILRKLAVKISLFSDVAANETKSKHTREIFYIGFEDNCDRNLKPQLTQFKLSKFSANS